MNRISLQSRLYRSPAFTIAGVMLIAASLRAPVTGIAPLTDTISSQLGLNDAAAGMLITLPLLAFSVVSLVAPVLARRHGLERSLFGAMVLMVAGVLARSIGPAVTLFAGTLIASTGIAIGNVLLPSLLKRDFPDRAAGLTTIYVLVLSIAAGVASAAAVPLAEVSTATWRFSAGAMVVLPLLAAFAWAPQIGRGGHMATQQAESPGVSSWRCGLAWQVTFYLGINSFVFYVIISWLPAILRDSGHSAAEAGALHGLLQMISTVPALFLGPLMRRLPDQRALGASAALLSLVGSTGLLVAPGWSEAWVILLGVGTGAGVMLGLAFVTLRTASPQLAASLSSMAQFIGYLFASAGPVLVGTVRGVTGNWTAALILCAAMCALMAMAALGAGRNARIGEPRRNRRPDAAPIAGAFTPVPSRARYRP